MNLLWIFLKTLFRKFGAAGRRNRMKSLTVIDQMFLAKLSRALLPKTKELIDDLIKDGHLSDEMLITVSGIFEFCGFKFNSARFVDSLSDGEGELSKVRSKVDQFNELFTGHLNGEKLLFGLNRFKEITLARLAQERAYSATVANDEHGTLSEFYDRIVEYIVNFNENGLLNYWAIRAISGKAYHSRFVSNSLQFTSTILNYCLANDIPCARLLLNHAATVITNGSIANFSDDSELQDEDALWLLTFGKLGRRKLSKIVFVTQEIGIAHAVESFVAVACGFFKTGLIANKDRLKNGSGKIFVIGPTNSDGIVTVSTKEVRQLFEELEPRLGLFNAENQATGS